MSKVPLPPREPKVVGEEYANVCAVLGEKQFKMHLMQKEIDTLMQKVKESFGELLRSHEKYDPKPEAPIVTTT